MRRIVIIMIIALASSTSNAAHDNCALKKEHGSHKNFFLDAATDYKNDEYSQNIDDYDQHVCDGVQSPKISTAQIMLTELFGMLLVRYITMREMARIYFKDFKDSMSRWFTMMTSCIKCEKK